MSEPEAAFLTLKASRGRLVRWLDAPIRPAASWTDWRAIPGSYYFDGGIKPMADISDAEMAAQVAECHDALGRFATNRAYLRAALDFAEAPYFKRCTYDEACETFVAGTLTYAENLTLYMQFLTVARGGADALPGDGAGLALIHNYLWYPEEQQVALRLGPGPATAFVAPRDEHGAAVALFQPIVDEMVAISSAAEDPAYKAPLPRDILDSLA